MKPYKLSKYAFVALLLSSASLLSATTWAGGKISKVNEVSTIHLAMNGEQGNVRQGRHQKMRGKRFKHMASALALTVEQRQQVRDIFAYANNEREKYQPLLAVFHQSMQTLLTAASFDQQAILALKASYKSTFEQLDLIKAKSQYQLYALLTPVQQDKWRLQQAKKYN
jgi:periplasmic protein CpxP/Spy